MDKLSKAILKEAVQEEPTPKSHSKNPVDHWTPAILKERALYLRKMAEHSQGWAAEKLADYEQHFPMLLYRNRDGEAEVHANFADLFYLIDGSATLLTGGKVIGARSTGPGEIRGDSIEGGTHQSLKPGDLIHVPVGVPHQMLVGGKTATCLIMKMQQTQS
jgi:mannose-6-phosphate isomerase-like protein (cupin superfamily)